MGVLASVVAAVALVPVTVVAPVVGAPADGWDRLPISAPSTLTIELSGVGAVSIGFPVFEIPEAFDPDHSVLDPGPFHFDEGTRTLSADSPGRTVIRGVFGDAGLNIVSVSGSAAIVIQRDTDEATAIYRFESAGIGSAGGFIEIPSPLIEQVLKSPYAFQVPETPAGARVYIGDRPIDVPSARLGGALLIGAMRAVAGSLVILAGALGVVAVSWLHGRSILALTGSHRSPAAVTAGVGFSALAVLANTLAYFLNTTATAIVMLIWAAAVVFIAARKRTLASLVQDWSHGAKSLLLVVPMVAISFFPILEWGGWYAGNFKTDLYEYANLSSFAADHSLIEMRTLPEAQDAGVLTAGAGFVWRSIDSVAASLITRVGNISTVAGFTLLGISLTMLFALGVADLANGSTRSRRWVVMLALMSPLFGSLFVENYLSHFFLIALVPAFIATLRFALQDHRGRKASWILAISSLSAAMIAVYPYFFFVIGLAVLAGALTFRNHRMRAKAILLPVGLVTAALVNLTWMTVARFSETAVYEQGLDAITRHTLLSGLSPAALVEVAAGTRAYHWRDSGIALAGLAQPGQGLAEWARNAVSPSIWWLLVGFVAILGLALATDLRQSFHSIEGRLSWFVVGAWIVFSAVSFLLDRPYIVLKGVWTGAALVPLLVITARWRPRLRRLALTCLAALAVVWATVGIADRVYWILPNPGSEVRLAHIHISAVPDLARVNRSLAVGTGAVAVATGNQPLRGYDRDRVLTAHIMTLLRDHDRPCTSCDAIDLDDSLLCVAAKPVEVIIVGLSYADDVCGLTDRTAGGFVETYRAQTP